jgi:molecular chaperone GrpE
MTEEKPKNDKDGEKNAVQEGSEVREDAGLKDRLLRMAAEFDNYKKRVAKDMDNSKEMGRAEVISKLLPTVDEFELAIGAFESKDEHLKGIDLIYSNMMSTLHSFGLREIEVSGKFDPYRHEIMLAQESDKEDGAIIKVVRKGYLLNTIMLRPASVIVSKGSAQAEGKEKKADGHE